MRNSCFITSNNCSILYSSKIVENVRREIDCLEIRLTNLDLTQMNDTMK